MKTACLGLFACLFSYTLFAQSLSTGLKFLDRQEYGTLASAVPPLSGTNLPAQVDLSSKMPPVGNQGGQNSCVAWACVYAVKSYQEKVERNSSYVFGGSLDYNKVFSPSYVYNQINNGLNAGSYYNEALNILSSQGVTTWSDMPYQDMDFITRPNQQQRQRAAAYKISLWRKINFADPNEVKSYIAAGYPIMIGAPVNDDFIRDGRSSDHFSFSWRPQHSVNGTGHAMVAVGYDDNTNRYKIMNSWGRQWGNDGYCYIGYDLFSTLIREAYIMKDIVSDNTQDITPNNPQQPVITRENTLNAEFNLSNVAHNLPHPNGAYMRFDGNFKIPSGLGTTLQVVVRIYRNNGFNQKGVPVGSLNPVFMTRDGIAAGGAPLTTTANFLPTMSYNYSVSIPYSALNVPRGFFNPQLGRYVLATTDLIAEPVLFIDNFAVKVGQLYPFYVSL